MMINQALKSQQEDYVSSNGRLHDDGGLWKSWTLACAAGELLGIGLAATVAVLAFRWFGEPATITTKLTFLAMMVAAGTLEGLLIGIFQWRVIRRVFPAIPARAWISVTVAVAATGWFLGMLPSIFPPPVLASAVQTPAPDLSLMETAAAAAVFGLFIGAIFGSAQWLVLRRYARKAGLWIAGNALGWSVAIVLIFIAASLPEPGTPWPLVTLVGSSAGLLAGLSIGAITGVVLLRIQSYSMMP